MKKTICILVPAQVTLSPVYQSKVTAQSIPLSWEVVTGAKQYNITYCVSGDKNAITLENTTNTSYELTGLKPGQEYSITVVATIDDLTGAVASTKQYTGKARLLQLMVM